MSYIVPSVLVYQDLENSGGVLNSTPDLEACIIGPAYNKLQYVPGSIAAQIKTAAQSTSFTTGSVVSGSNVIAVASTAGFVVGDSLIVVGAGANGSNLQANVTAIIGNQVSLDAAASTAVSDAVVTKTGRISNSTVDNTFTIPGQVPGQVIDEASINVWLNDARVETLVTGVRGRSLSNVLTVDTVTNITGGITQGTTALVVNSTAGLVTGDSIQVAGAGASGAILTTTVTNISGLNLTVTPAAGTTVVGASVTKVGPGNVNTVTNTLKVEAGDEVVFAYTDNTSTTRTFTTSVKSVVTTSGQNGIITTFDTVDMLPNNVSVQTLGDITSATNVVAVTDATGFTVGDFVSVVGAGGSNTDLTAAITDITGLDVTLDSPAGATVTGVQVIKVNRFSASFVKTYNDQVLPAVRPISGGASLDTSLAGTDGTLEVKANPEVVYGSVLTGDVFIEYRALRTDLADRVLTIEDIDDLKGQLGDISDENPLALGVQIALSNTVGRIRAIAVTSNDLAGYLEALATSEGERLYALVPLTQDESICAAVKAHVDQLSTPENASWRVGIVNTAMPLSQNIGQYSSGSVNANGGANTVSVIAGKYILTASNATFITDGVTPGDIVNITVSTPSTQQGTHQVLEVISNQQVVINATATSTAVSYYVSRTLSRTQIAQEVADKAKTFGDKRIWYVQPDIVGVSVNGVVKYLPGYYLCCGLAGMTAGFPVQQGFTNIGVAGISDLKHSNYYFTKAQLNTMAESGVFLFAQETQGGIPYVRHELTTDVSVLEYREALVVKNWDFLSYFYYDKLKSFIGSWNITNDTINIIRQTIVASSELVKAKKLPKIGSPLLGYNIRKLEQDKFNKDNLNVEVAISVVYPLNYLNLHLVI